MFSLLRLCPLNMRLGLMGIDWQETAGIDRVATAAGPPKTGAPPIIHNIPIRATDAHTAPAKTLVVRPLDLMSGLGSGAFERR
mmetsp:Transcript_18528/g.25762  ORF Transcript_18528/g.25762 Transcript_18528/m.25762 type:complete len:83 (+) Transcript_18528:1006-1254(+)